MPSINEKISDNIDLIWDRFSVEKRYAVLRKFFDGSSAAEWSDREWGRLPHEAKKNFGNVVRELAKKYNGDEIRRYAADKTGEIDNYDDEAVASGRHKQDLKLGMNVRVLHPNAVDGNHDKTWTIVESESSNTLTRPDNPHGLLVRLYDRAGNDGGSWEPKDVVFIGTYSHDIGIPDEKIDELKGMEFGLEELEDWRRSVNAAPSERISDDLKGRSLKILDEQIEVLRNEISRKRRFEVAFKNGFELGKKTAVEDCDSTGNKRSNVREIAEQFSGRDSIGEGIIDNLNGDTLSGYMRGLVKVREDVNEHIEKGHMPSSFGKGYKVKIQTKNDKHPMDSTGELPEDGYVNVTSDETINGSNWGINLREDNLRDIEWLGLDSAGEKEQFIIGFIDGYDSYKCETFDAYALGKREGEDKAEKDCVTHTKMGMGDRDKIIELGNTLFEGFLNHEKGVKEKHRSDFVDGFFVTYAEFKCPQEECNVGDKAEINCELQSVEISLLNREVPKNFGRGYVAEIKEIEGEQVKLFGNSTLNMNITGEWTFVLSRDCLKCPSDNDLTEPEDYPIVKKPKIKREDFVPMAISGVKLLKVKCPSCGGKRVIEADNRKICLICGNTFN